MRPSDGPSAEQGQQRPGQGQRGNKERNLRVVEQGSRPGCASQQRTSGPSGREAPLNAEQSYRQPGQGEHHIHVPGRQLPADPGCQGKRQSRQCSPLRRQIQGAPCKGIGCQRGEQQVAHEQEVEGQVDGQEEE